jgi:tetratricopeptide (TPR) repeat protein
MSGLLALSLFALAAPTSEPPAAREQARICEKLTGEESLFACRRAIDLGLSPERLWPVRQIVARRLVSLERWNDLAEHFRRDVAIHPSDPEARLRLGSTLLFALGRHDDAVPELAEAARLAPEAALPRGLLALAHAASGRLKEAVDHFEEALRLDEDLLDHRPGMRAAFEAARRGQAWP